MPRVVRTLISTVILSLLVVVSSDPASAKSAGEIDAETNQALDTLYAQSSAAKELGAKSLGILVFPSITKGGLIVGGEYGEGALRVDGKTQGYYSSASAAAVLGHSNTRTPVPCPSPWKLSRRSISRWPSGCVWLIRGTAALTRIRKGLRAWTVAAVAAIWSRNARAVSCGDVIIHASWGCACCGV